MLLLKELFSITRDRAFAFKLALLWACSYACYSGFLDVLGWGDAYAHFFLMVAICFRSPALIFSSILMASFTDELAFINSSFILLYHGFDFKSMRFEINRPLLSIIFAWIIYLAMRYILYRLYGLYTPTGMLGLQVTLDNISLIPLGLITGIKSLWCLILIPVFLLWQSKEYRVATIILFFIFVSVFCSILVYDVARAISYLFPAALLGLKIIYERKKQYLLIPQLFWLILFSALFPSFYIIREIIWIKPLPIFLLNDWMGQNRFFQ